MRRIRSTFSSEPTLTLLSLGAVYVKGTFANRSPRKQHSAGSYPEGLKGPSGQTVQTFQCHIEEDLNRLVRCLWEQEEITTTRAISKENQNCEEHFRRSHYRKADGRYVVGLPTITPLPDLTETRFIAARVQKHMEVKFARDTSFRELYEEFMKQYASLKHMTLSKSDAEETRKGSCYLPHHGVMRESSSTTKLRVVFNGSTRVSSGETLNQYLLTGENLLPSLADILLRWRHHRFVLATDIEKMYRQVEVRPQDRDLQRILWRDNPTQDIKEYQLNTVTYGLACAPFLALRTLRQLAEDEETNYPMGAQVLRQDVYMGDILTGTSTLEEARELQKQLCQICKAGGFPLKKWSANDDSLLNGLPAEDLLRKEPRGWQPGESHLTLGLRWHPWDDNFSFTIPPWSWEKVSRRSILSLAARLFDPLGWLAPTTVRAKIWIRLGFLEWTGTPLYPKTMLDDGRNSRESWRP